MAAVSFGDAEMTRRFCAARRAPFPCYADPERRAYDAFGLERKASLFTLLDPRQLGRTVNALTAGHAMYKGRLSTRQMPGTFLIDTAGELRYEHRNRYPADNPSVDELLAAADALAATASRQS